jgi:peptide deformylase
MTYSFNPSVRILGDAVLRQDAGVVTEFGQPLDDLAYDMYEAMIDSDGIGLAAPQVGLSIQFLVTGIPNEDDDHLDLQAWVNPEILETQGACTIEEGCLSVPDIREDITRPERIHLRWQSIDGEWHQAWFDDLEARVLQHEIDHLKGVLFVDLLSANRKTALRERLRQMEKKSS